MYPVSFLVLLFLSLLDLSIVREAPERQEVTFPPSSSRQNERVKLLINNVIIGGPPEASHDQDGVMAEVLTMHENKERLDPV